MFFMKLAYHLRKQKVRSLDEPILQMVDLRSRKDPHDIAVWNSLLVRELGPQAVIDYDAMSNAVPIVFAPECLHLTENINWTLQKKEQEEFYLGYPGSCPNAKPAMVKDLDPSLELLRRKSVKET